MSKTDDFMARVKAKVDAMPKRSGGDDLTAVVGMAAPVVAGAAAQFGSESFRFPNGPGATESIITALIGLQSETVTVRYGRGRPMEFSQKVGDRWLIIATVDFADEGDTIRIELTSNAKKAIVENAGNAAKTALGAIGGLLGGKMSLGDAIELAEDGVTITNTVSDFTLIPEIKGRINQIGNQLISAHEDARQRARIAAEEARVAHEKATKCQYCGRGRVAEKDFCACGAPYA